MKNKKILIGSLIALGIIGGFFLFKNKNLKNALNDDETGGNVDFDYANASGSNFVDILNRYKKKHIIPVKKYQNFIKSANINELKKYLMFKNIYTLQDNVNIRATPLVNNAIINFFEPAGIGNFNKTGTIPKKNTYVGKVCYIKQSEDGKYLWLGITEAYSNKFISRVFNWDKSSWKSASYLCYKSNNCRFNYGTPIRWVRSDVSVVDLSKENQIFKNIYSDYFLYDE